MQLHEHIKNSEPDNKAPKWNTHICPYEVHKLKTLYKITEINGDNRTLKSIKTSSGNTLQMCRSAHMW